MPADLPVTLAVACEDRGHFDAVTHLVDRRLRDRIPWADGILEHLRTWVHGDELDWFVLKKAKERARGLKLPTQGHFGGDAGLPDAGMIRAQLLYLAELRRRGAALDAVLLVRDLDRSPKRLEGIFQGVHTGTWPFAVVVAWCEPEVEAWKIACFVPEDVEENTRLASLRRRLSFCPTAEPERLTSTVLGSERDAKTVARELFDAARGWRCLDLPFSELRSRGRSTGLAAFIDELDAKLVPLVEGRSRP